ncbi:MAG: phosphatidylserine synthase [Epsilonproteobacteria bacterium]|nr:phosphatidylserine synthase [Campylobacterota bacterium]
MNLFDKNNHFNLANLITFANVSLGVVALYFVTQKQFLVAIILAWIAGALDILDGKIARKFNLSTEFGVELDSFADFLSFVIMPAFLLYYSLEFNSNIEAFIIGLIFIYYIISGLRRLVNFNLNTNAGEVSRYFIGVPTPLGAILLWVLYLLYHTFGVINEWVVAIFVALIAYLLNSNIKIPHP